MCEVFYSVSYYDSAVSAYYFSGLLIGNQELVSAREANK